MTPGTRIGGYEIIARIGAGGMGEVYRARDTRLQRDVAIKILPDLFARDPERLARFEREARTLAALNHPHVAQVHAVEIPPEGGSHRPGFIVMEFVDGEDLADRIARGGALPVDDTLPIALQIAQALEAAHAQGIIHRDLKPANIKVRADGEVKVLDFGLAKALAPDGASPGAIENSPTITSPFQLSQLGVILGTAAYMAPEQAKGKPVDKRADIWAFGCVVYEMLTGTRAFTGEDVTDTLAAIVRADPDWSRLPSDTPPVVRTLLRRCLEKDPRERLPDIGAARLELKDARVRDTHSPQPASATPRGGTAISWIVVGAAIVAAIVTGIYAVAMRPAPDARVYKSVIVPPAPLTAAPVRRMQISPDGRRLAFVAPDTTGQTVLWVRPLEDAQAQPLRGTEGAGAPFWSADSRWLAFQADGKLKKVEAAGGTVTTIGESGETPPGTWSRDNVILTSGTHMISRRSSSGGPATPVTAAGPDGRIYVSPFFLPDGRHFLYATSGVGMVAPTIYLGSIDSHESTRLIDGAVPQYASGYLLFLRGSLLMAQRFDPGRLVLSGEAAPLAEDVQINTATGTGAFSVSQTGELVFQTGAAVGSRLTWFDRAGKTLGSVGDAGPYADVMLSPDGRWASTTKSSEGRSDVWLIDVARNLPRRFTLDSAGGFAAVWRPTGGQRIVYAVRRSGSTDLAEQAIDGTGKAETIFSDGKDKYPIAFTPDGTVFLYLQRLSAVQGRLWTLRLPDRTPRLLFPESDPPQQSADMSPNGRWIAYTSVTDDGASRLYIASFPDGGAKREIVVSRSAATPHWRGDGRELYFTTPGKLMAVDVATSGAALDIGVPHALFDVTVPAAALGVRSTYAVTPDGQRFLFNTWDMRSAVTPITLIVNWPQLLAR